ncbi:MAG: alpha-amylase [Bacteroidales bacterium]|nr:alpha-amylase [Bacteroidales bacterium]
MKKAIYALMLAALLFQACGKENNDSPADKWEIPSYSAGEKQGNISYQLLIYSFADSDGDGIGDFNGIKSKLDYLDALGVSAIWLSPAHPADSYHGYDVQDYSAVNPKYGTEADFKALLDAAHAKDIKIYMDYVLNHTGKGNVWFAAAKKGEINKEFGWFHISANPSADIAAGKFPMLTSYNSGEWHDVTVGDIGYEGRLHFKVDFSGSVKTLTVTTSEAAAQQPNTDTSVNMFLWVGEPGKAVRMYKTGTDIYEITLDFSSPWGVLVRSSDTSWDNGTKWGAPKGANVLSFGTPLALSTDDAHDILFGSPSQMKFQGAFGSWMPDLNYGAVSTASSSGAFEAIAETADKWIGMGVDGFRLDAVKHIYSNERGSENPAFLKLWYDRCNETFRKTHSSDIYMVGEVWMDASAVAPYYKGLPANFEFDFWERLKWVLNQRTGCYFAKDLMSYRTKYAAVRADAIPATKLTNHDETRAATILGKDLAKLKQAAAFLMTAEGQPYIYQGEELGYWGKDGDDGGRDELVRTPIVWDKASSAAVGDLSGNVDATLVTDEISVEKQKASSSSLLRTYFEWTKARNSCPALAGGKMSAHQKYNDSNTLVSSVAAWYMTASDGSKALVLHNVGSNEVSLDLSGDKLDKQLVSLGSVSVDGSTVKLGASSSVVYVQ